MPLDRTKFRGEFQFRTRAPRLARCRQQLGGGHACIVPVVEMAQLVQSAAENPRRRVVGDEALAVFPEHHDAGIGVGHDRLVQFRQLIQRLFGMPAPAELRVHQIAEQGIYRQARNELPLPLPPERILRIETDLDIGLARRGDERQNICKTPIHVFGGEIQVQQVKDAHRNPRPGERIGVEQQGLDQDDPACQICLGQGKQGSIYLVDDAVTDRHCCQGAGHSMPP